MSAQLRKKEGIDEVKEQDKRKGFLTDGNLRPQDPNSGGRSLVGSSPWGREESDRTERLD